MRNRAILLVAGAAALVIAGCGGSSGSSSRTSVTRVVAGYVYVENNNGIDAGPSVIIAPSSTPPSGYYKPTAGTVTLTVNDGTITRSSATLSINVATNNEVIATVKSVDATPAVVVAGTGLELSGTPKGDLAAHSVALGTTTDNGKVLGLTVNAPGTYTPGAVASIKVLVKDNGATTPVFGAPGDVIPSGFISGDTYDVAAAAFDANGVVVTGATPVVTSSAPTVAVNGSSTVLTPVIGTGAAAGALTITTTVGSVNTAFTSSFGYGTVTHVTLTPAGPTALLWNVTGGPAPATQAVTATVTNQYDAPVPNASVAFTGTNIATNVWAVTAGGTAFASPTVTTGNDGTAANTLTAPANANGVLSNADKAVKGTNTLTATVNSVTGTATINITRPLASVAITGVSRLDVGTTSPAVGVTNAFTITNGVDVDNDTVATPTGAITWSITNVPGVGNIGDLDDLTAKSTSAATINASTGVVTAGAVAGQATVSVTVGTTPSNNLTVDIYGAPSKIKYTPATTAGGYSGSKTGVVFDLIDNWGHTIPTAEYTFTKTGTADSLSGAVFNNLAGRTFDITAGSGSGTFTLTVSGNWVGATGGTATIAKTRTTTIAP